MLLYADEDCSFPVVVILRQLGHDIVTGQQDGRASAPDPDVLARAHPLGRAVLTCNRRDSERLNRQGAANSGIVSVTHDNDFPGLAARIHAAPAGLSPRRWCLKMHRPPAGR